MLKVSTKVKAPQHDVSICSSSKRSEHPPDVVHIASIVVDIAALSMASSAPLLSGTIEADDDAQSPSVPAGRIGSAPSRSAADPVRLIPGTQASAASAEEGGIVSQSIS